MKLDIEAARTPAELVLDAHIAKRCDTCASWSDPMRHADDEMDGLCLQIKSGCFGLLRYASETCPYWSAK
ncbi:MAG: hypothetical protein ABMA00_15435 [Gemmatimonas sp.]